jgi:hypothetical protein
MVEQLVHFEPFCSLACEAYLNTDFTVCPFRSDQLLLNVDLKHMIVQVPYCLLANVAKHPMRCLLTDAEIFPRFL